MRGKGGRGQDGREGWEKRVGEKGKRRGREGNGRAEKGRTTCVLDFY